MSPTVAVPGKVLEGIVQISVGLAHVCAVTRTHEIVCWGDNSAGQLGVGRNMRTVAGQLLQPHVVGGLPPMTQVAAGTMHTCGITDQGAVWCWGSAGGDLKQSIGGASGSIELRGSALGTPVPMALGDGPAQLVALAPQGNSACAVFAGDVRCWNTFQAIPINASTAPGPNAQITQLAGVTAIALSHGKVCAVAPRGLWCWHDNQQPTLVTWRIATKLAPVNISLGQMYACTLFATGPARCWQSLIDDFWQRPPTHTLAWRGQTTTRAIAVGDSPICSVDANGQVDCFLSDEAGLTDDAAAASWATTTLGPNPIAGVDAAVAVGLGAGRNVMGYGFGCALRTATAANRAEVMCWGDNESGQLGHGDTDATLSAVPVLAATE